MSDSQAMQPTAVVRAATATSPSASLSAGRLEQFVALYNELNFSNLAVLREIYAADVEFVDPVHQINGLSALEQYFAHAYQNLQQCHFAIVATGEGAHWGFVSWQMRFCHSAINGGREVCVDGCTELTYNAAGQISRHRDYYDLTQMIYQHLPVLGWLTGKVRQKMADA